MPNIPADVVGQAASTAATATQNAATLSQSPQSHWYDVWSETGSGLSEHSTDPQYIATHLVPGAGVIDSRIRMAQAMGRDWGHTNWDGLKAGMSQQASAVADQAGQLWDGKTADGKDMTKLQRVGAAFGLLSSIEQLVTMPLGAIPFPAFPAVRITDTDIGLPHAHMHPPNLTPPNPVPVPLPSTGPIIPIPFVSGASKTLINSMPAARCGDMGLGVFCGGFFPMYEVFLGSANVWIEGNRAGRVGVDITKHCIFSAPKPNDPPLGPMFGSTVSCSTNVMIGGIPLPSLTSMAIAGAFKLAFKGLGKLIKAVRKKPPGLPRAGHVPAADPRLKGPMLFQLAQDVVDVRKLTTWARDMAAAGNKRLVLPRGSAVSLQELMFLTKATGTEWGVVLDKNGRLALVGGEATALTGWKAGDQVLAHTHPSDSATLASNISEADLNVAQGQRGAKQASGQVAITKDGEVHYFDHNGVSNTPTQSPLNPQTGLIDGKTYYPGHPEGATPRGFDNHPPGTDLP